MMFYLLTILGLAGVYVLALANFAWENIATGLVLATVLVVLFRRAVFSFKTPSTEFVIHILLRSPKFLAYLILDILKGTWQVTLFVLEIRKLEHPGIVKIPFGGHSDEAVGFVGHLITVSPGSFVVDIDWDDRTMLVHYIDASNPKQLREDVEKYYRLWEYGAHIPTPHIPAGPNRENP
jgi:multisubunit Na+/H+ antiporter MnhE subunit